MARIRTVKPEFWTDGVIISLPYEVRLFYIGMWNHACDRGHLADDPLGLKLKILPADMVDGAELVSALVDAGRVERMELPDGRAFLVIPRFADHQRIDTRWTSRCPVCAHLDSTELAETHASLREPREVPQKPHVGEEGRGREGKGRESAHAPLSPFCTKHPTGTDDACRPCGTARARYELALRTEKNKPTPTPTRTPECEHHPGYPLPCDRCARDATERRTP